MSNVIPFQPKPSKSIIGQIVISCGQITESPDPRDIGQTVYSLTFFDAEGGYCGVWDGDTYEEAVAADHEWHRDGVEVIDQAADYLH